MPFRASIRIRPGRAALQAALLGLTALNRVVMRERHVPPLYTTGVVWKREPRGREDWDTADIALARGYSDCEDLAAWRAAELQEAGETEARAIVVPTGPGRWHAVVERGDGTRSIEDPSRITLALARRRMRMVG